jgi:hypothetical protein
MGGIVGQVLHGSSRTTANPTKSGAKIRTISPERLIFLNESGVTTSMTRLYARSLGGTRICEGTPDSRWKMLTILGALSTRGVVAAMTIEEA